jgi:hypothetical protein
MAWLQALRMWTLVPGELKLHRCRVRVLVCRHTRAAVLHELCGVVTGPACHPFRVEGQCHASLCCCCCSSPVLVTMTRAGDGIVGSRVRVWWPMDGVWYRGVVADFNAASQRHRVLYDDGDMVRTVCPETGCPKSDPLVQSLWCWLLWCMGPQVLHFPLPHGLALGFSVQYSMGSFHWVLPTQAMLTRTLVVPVVQMV